MATHVLYKLGAEFLRHYCQGIWLKDGHPRFYRHVDGFYTKLLARMEKQELQPATHGSGTVMSKGTATADYIMEDPREALRLELKVDPYAWVQKYLAHRVCPGAEVLSVDAVRA